MNAARLLDEVRAAGGQVRLVSPDRLRVEAPQPLPEALVESLRTYKPAIIIALRQTAQPNRLSFDHEAFAERTAIIQANSIPEAWATGFATLCTMPCPATLMPERWQQIIDDGGRFLDRWGRQAALMGWNATDVFGVDPAMPDTAYRSMGLVPLLAGRNVCAITADTARIDCGNGVTQTFTRCRVTGEAVTVWLLK